LNNLAITSSVCIWSMVSVCGNNMIGIKKFVMFAEKD